MIYTYLFTFILSLAALHGNQDGHLLSLLDKSNNTYLFRGKLAHRNSEFQYESLRDNFQKSLSDLGEILPKDFGLLCISFLNSTEWKKCNVEAAWFRVNSCKGYLWRYPLFGSFIDPRYLPEKIRIAIIHSDPDGLQFFMNQLNCLLKEETYKERLLIIYMHCNAGKDRTGEAAACYLMQFRGVSYRNAVNESREIANRELKMMSLNAIRWYAFYLRDVKGVLTVGRID